MKGEHIQRILWTKKRSDRNILEKEKQLGKQCPNKPSHQLSFQKRAVLPSLTWHKAKLLNLDTSFIISPPKGMRDQTVIVGVSNKVNPRDLSAIENLCRCFKRRASLNTKRSITPTPLCIEEYKLDIQYPVYSDFCHKHLCILLLIANLVPSGSCSTLIV